MLSEKLRQAIQDIHVRLDLLADHGDCDTVTASEFADTVNEEHYPYECSTVTTINQVLLYLRKEGAAAAGPSVRPQHPAKSQHFRRVRHSGWLTAV